MNWIFYVLSPVLLHLLVSEITAILAGSILDSAALTALSAVLVLPFAIRMYRRDSALHGKASGNCRKLISRESDLKACLKSETDATNTIIQSSIMRVLSAGLLSFAGGGLLNLLWSWLLNLLLNLLGLSSFFTNEVQEALFASSLIMQLLGPGLLVPVAEELVFRGLIYTRMRTRMQIRQAVFFSALLFALYHGNPIQMLYAFPMALILALLYDRQGNLVFPILFHMGANLTAIFMAL